MTTIDTWTREQCEEYLNKYPHSLNSEAVRKRLESLTPSPKPSGSTKAENTNNVADIVDGVKRAKEDASNPPHKTTPKLQGESYQTPAGMQRKATGSYVDEHEKDMAVVGKVVLSVLALAVCLGLGWGLTELFGISYGLAAKGVSVLVATPIETWIWKK